MNGTVMVRTWLEHYSFIAIHWEHCNKKEKKKQNKLQYDHDRP